MSSLRTTLTQVESEESLAAVSYLFSLNLRQVASPVINQHFAELVQMILGLLAKNFNSTALLKSLVASLGTVLKRGTTVDSWSMQDTKEIGSHFDKILNRPFANYFIFENDSK